MSFLILLLITILPSYILGRYIYKKDTEKKPKKLITKIIIISIVFTIIAAVLEWLFKSVWTTSQTFFEYLVEYMIGVAFIEELCKYLPTYFVGIKDKTINNRYDTIVYAAFSAIGFATFENILYVFTSGGMSTAIYRMIFSVPAHTAYGILMGYFLGIACQEKQNENKKQYRKNIIYSLLIPTIFHTMYDFSIIYGVTSSNGLILVSAYIVEIIVFFYAIRKVKKVANDEEKKKSSGRNLLIIGCAIIALLWGMSNFNVVRLDNSHYNMKENVKVKEDDVSIIVDSYEEDKTTKEITLNVKIRNLSNKRITVETDQFTLVNMNDTSDVKSLSKFETNNRTTLPIDSKETIATKIKFKNVVRVGNNDYLLGYESKEDSTKTYVIYIGKDFAQALQARNS